MNDIVATENYIIEENNKVSHRMYELRPESIKTFIEDSSIELPRFQRKITWSDRENFNLCLSIFKNYPIGVVVLTRDDQNGEGSKKYLLDGRQRRYALKKMRNPEEIYLWSKSAIGFRTFDSAEDVADRYWEYVDEYFGREEYEPIEEELEVFGPEESNDEDRQEENDNSDTVEETFEEQDSSIDINEDNGGYKADLGLKKLLHLIQVVHPLNKPASGLTKPFDFRDAIPDLEYLETNLETNTRYIDTEQLLAWIHYRKNISGEQLPLTQDDFYRWLVSGNDLERGEEWIREEIDRKWERIRSVLEVINSLEKKLQDSTIGYLLLRNASANDEKKIFEIINTAGTSLTAVEILSAKPAWNIEVDDPHQDIINCKRDLYADKIELSSDEVVRWDTAATLLDRLDINYIINKESTRIEDSMTLGFKIMSGYYSGAIAKDDVEAIGQRDDLPWGTLQLESDINQMVDLLGEHETIQFWKDWGLSLKDITSVAISLNFLLIMMKKWEMLGKPTQNSTEMRQFRQCGAILLDRSIYEYITGQWRGSTESRISSNLTSINGTSSLFEPVSENRWDQLIGEIIESGRIENQSYLERKSVDKRIRLVLHYYYVLKGIGAPRQPNVKVDIDHIIPKSIFESSTNEDLKRYKHHICNLAPLPSKPNKQKGEKTLNELNDEWLKSEVERYTEIHKDDFNSFSDITDINDLIDYRSSLFKHCFENKRLETLDR